MHTQRQFFRRAIKVELKAHSRRRTLKRILQSHGRKASLGNMVMLALGMRVD